MERPKTGDYPPYFEIYIQLVPENNPIKALQKNIFLMADFVKKISPEKENFSYAKNKWTVKEVLGHIVDTERIMAYRALRIARNDKTNIEGFDEDAFVANAHFGKQSTDDLLNEYLLVRKSNIALFSTFNEEELQRKGIANGKEITALAMIYMLTGHELHHLNILKERYFVGI
ncbi:MAG TPA: DinB family protein [Bacteroidia bacterium]|nr:DinB family protein [Bacteroidia bacterium]